MAATPIKRALISVYDKTGAVDLARGLATLGVEIISTGGTAKLLANEGIEVTGISQVTHAPEMLDGRVKTLHPKIHGALLADRDNPDHLRQLDEQGITPIDIVVCNLYPFEKVTAQPGCAFADAIENIDIGGPCMVRAAAKNHRHVLIVSSPDDYSRVVDAIRAGHGTIASDDPLRLELAHKAFGLVWRYNQAITGYLAEQMDTDDSPLPPTLGLAATRNAALRYGENPHQAGALYQTGPAVEGTIAAAKQIHGMGMSFINYLDAHAALELVRDLRQLSPCAAAIIKHASPCGAAAADSPVEAYRRAYLSDPGSAFGGILAINAPVDATLADAVMNCYAKWGKAAGAAGFLLHVWVAPAFHPDAVTLINDAKRWGQEVRLLEVGPIGTGDARYDLKAMGNAMLVQAADTQPIDAENWTVVTNRKPTDAEMADLRFAWIVCKHVKSNAITIARDGMLIGAGAGQTSRMVSCKLAAEAAADRGKGASAASDAYFPFPDGPALLVEAGVTAIIQPGGSKGDQATIDYCNENNVAMVFTGTRHFRH